MSNKLIALIVGIFILIVAGMFGFAYLKKAEAPAVEHLIHKYKHLKLTFIILRVLKENISLSLEFIR